MIVCFKCAKEIKGGMVTTSPSILEQQLGVDFPKSYHRECWVKAELEAADELGRTETREEILSRLE